LSTLFALPEGDVRDLLLRITQQMARARDLDQLLQTIVNAAMQVAPAADKAVIHLLDMDHQLLLPRYCSSPSLIADRSAGIPAGRGIAGRALRARQAVYVPDTWADDGFEPLGSGPELRCLLVAPLLVENTPLGALSLSSGVVGAFSEADRDYVATLAAQAALAILQADLLREALVQRERSETIIQSISDGLAILNGDGCLLRVNPALLDMLRLAPTELSLPCQLCAQPLLERLLDPSHGRIVGPYEIEVRFAPEDKVTLHVDLSPLSGSDDTVMIVRDTTSEREALESRALFISAISHDLRTPLQHILGFVNLITDIPDLSDEEQVQYIRHVEDETYHMARLVDDLVALSRIEMGRFAVYPEPLRLDQLLEGVHERLQPRARLKGLSLELELDTLPSPAWAMADAVRVEQVLTNLIENAVKFTPEGGSITLSAVPREAEMVVSVRDTGQGMPPETLPRIFGAYYQVQRQARSHVGQGLGLYISQQIVEALRGHIWVESTLGQGSTFFFTLPAAAEGPQD
jgi:signal transduction histidine kinase/putative methionine-R-sulfoxide reductase with GAF domain